MADIPMNSFAPVTDAAYIYAEDAKGNQVKIKKSDLVEIIRANIPAANFETSGLMPNSRIYTRTITIDKIFNTGYSYCSLIRINAAGFETSGALIYFPYNGSPKIIAGGDSYSLVKGTNGKINVFKEGFGNIQIENKASQHLEFSIFIM